MAVDGVAKRQRHVGHPLFSADLHSTSWKVMPSGGARAARTQAIRCNPSSAPSSTGIRVHHDAGPNAYHYSIGFVLYFVSAGPPAPPGCDMPSLPRTGKARPYDSIRRRAPTGIEVPQIARKRMAYIDEGR